MGFGLGIPEIAVIVGVVVLLFGPSQLPKLGRALGDTLKEFRGLKRELTDVKDGAERDLRDVRDTVRRATRD